MTSVRTVTEHKITIKLVRARCGEYGHYDEIAECSCGKMKMAINPHQANDRAIPSAISGHRLEVIEKALAIRVEIEHKGYNDDER